MLHQSPHSKKSFLILPHNLLVNQLLQLLLAQGIFVLVEIEKFLRDRRRSGLVLGVVVGLEVWVLEGFLHRDSLHGVECEQLLQEVECQVGRLGEQGAERHLLLERQRADVLSCSSRLDAVVVLHGGRAEHIQDQSQLVVV